MARISKKKEIEWCAELVAYQCESPFTPRRGIAAVERMLANGERQLEQFQRLYGMDPTQLTAVLDKANKLDVEFG